MTDIVNKEKRSKIMACIRSKNTKPELVLKNAISGLYFRHQPKVYGKPDFAHKKNMIAIFVDGCFWHKCPKCFKPPKSNKKYWIKKIEGNIINDRRVTLELEKQGWTVMRFWEHDIINDPNKCVKIVKSVIIPKNPKLIK